MVEHAGTRDGSLGQHGTVAIVGGGAAGTLTAVQLSRRAPGVRVVLYDPAERPGRGLAYGTPDPKHLLNVRAGRMSGLADRPEHFVAWAVTHGHAVSPEAFLPRRLYGAYLEDLLAGARRTGRVVVRTASVTDVRTSPFGARLRTTAGEERADAVVLACGNAAPVPLPWEVAGGTGPGSVPAVQPDPADPAAPAGWSVPDPWARDVLAGVASRGPIALVGTGLTAVDVALSITERDPQRRIIAISRHGMLPGSHLSGPEPVWPTTYPVGDEPVTARGLLALLRTETAAAAAVGVDWRAVVDGLRPAVAGLWQRLPVEERTTFLRHVARYWEVHRHRMAPEIAARVGELRESGRLAVRRGRPLAAHAAPPGARIMVAGPDGRVSRLAVAAVVNCTGPLADVTRRTDPLLRALVTRGSVRPDPLRLGLDVTTDGAVVADDGAVDPRLYAIGPLRKGMLYETTAVPEIRQQAADLAEVLAGRFERASLTA